jgi:hypothetical protein
MQTFKIRPFQISSGNHDYMYDDEDFAFDTTTTTTTAKTTATTTTPPNESPAEPVVAYGKLMGIKYDPGEQTLLVCDYMNDQIDRVHFTDNENFGLESIETLLKLDFLTKAANRLPDPSVAKLLTMNPIMSALDSNHLYWIDYEEGLKVNSVRTPMVRTIYKIKEPVSLKLVYMTAPRLASISASAVLLASASTNGSRGASRLIELLRNVNEKFKYPPDYVYYLKYLKDQEEEAGEEAAAAAAAKNAYSREGSAFSSSSSSLSRDQSKIVLAFFLLLVSYLFVNYF